MGRVITFYSYKGGVGRTMALANIAVLLSQWGYKTLMVDWDLEAPGLEFYFKGHLDLEKISQQEGLADLLDKAADGESTADQPINWRDSLINIEVKDQEGALHLLTAGKRDKDYFNKVRELDLKSFYENKGGFFIERLRNEWKEAYDYILVDSRTGITDLGGVCTIQMPDVLVALFTATDQGLNGVIDVFQKANRARQKLPVSRLALQALPIPCRFDTGKEFKISQDWLDRFASSLSDFYANWLSASASRRDFLATTKIPYVAYFSFGEKLPVLEEGTVDPAGLGYAYEIAQSEHTALDWNRIRNQSSCHRRRRGGDGNSHP
jgi:cellulose biosynthesis protein BcsQ